MAIEAEGADEVSGGLLEGGNVGGLGNGDFLKFGNVDFSTGLFQAYLRASGGSGGSGLVRFRVGSPTGQILGDLALASTGGWDNYVTIPANAGGATGVHDLYVTFESGYAGDYVNVDRLQFGRAGQAPPDLSVGDLSVGIAPSSQSAPGTGAPTPLTAPAAAGPAKAAPRLSSKERKCIATAKRTNREVGHRQLKRAVKRCLR